MMQGNLSFATTQAALAAARAAGVRTLLNPAPVRWPAPDLWPLCDVAVVNRVEAEAFTGTADPEGGARAAGCRRRARGGGNARGGRRSLVVCRGARRHGRAEPVTAIDATGAGDSFCGTMCAALAAGATFPIARSTPRSAPLRSVSRAAAPTPPSRRATEAQAIFGDIAAMTERALHRLPSRGRGRRVVADAGPSLRPGDRGRRAAARRASAAT